MAGEKEYKTATHEGKLWELGNENQKQQGNNVVAALHIIYVEKA